MIFMTASMIAGRSMFPVPDLGAATGRCFQRDDLLGVVFASAADTAM
jgi:hypothetical protein